MGEGEFVDAFVNGARDLLGVALIIGIARGVTVIMTNGQITDTVLNAAEQAVTGLGGVAFINLMYLLFLPLSFLIPSSSGLATVAMPIMAPLAIFANVPPQLVVTAYQTGNGLVNLFTPTSAVVMGGLAIARVGYGTWLKFVWPMLLILAVLCMVVHVGGRDPASDDDRDPSGGECMTSTAAPATAARHGGRARLARDDAGRGRSRRRASTQDAGLTDAEVTTRRAKFGENKFAEAAKDPALEGASCASTATRCRSCCSVAGIVSMFLPGQFATGVVLVLLTVFNACLGLSQEGKAEASVAALQKMMVVQAKVRRNGAIAMVAMERRRPGRHHQHRGGRPGPGRRPHRPRRDARDRRVGADRRERPGAQELDAVKADAGARATASTWRS